MRGVKPSFDRPKLYPSLRSIETFRTHIFEQHSDRRPRTAGWPCTGCFGRGRQIDFATLTNTNIDFKTCEKCEGNGRGTKEAFKEVYDQHRKRHTEETARYDRTMSHWRSAVSKLTRDEIEALKTLGVYKN